MYLESGSSNKNSENLLHSGYILKEELPSRLAQIKYGVWRQGRSQGWPQWYGLRNSKNEFAVSWDENSWKWVGLGERPELKIWSWWVLDVY